MAEIDRQDIQLVSRHSNLDEHAINKLLTDNVHSKKNEWSRFLRLFFLAFGAGFIIAGIILFFAYNWNSIHKFAKLGIIQVLIIASIALSVFQRFSALARNIMLMVASALVGVLFAVFGQIYQTGADAYDFFLGWTFGVTLWVLVSGFPALWLLYLVLINITFMQYNDQVANHWPDVQIYTILFLINCLATLLFSFISEKRKDTALLIPFWFLNTIALFAVTAGTMGIVNGLFEYYYMNGNTWLVILCVLVFACYGYGLVYAFKNRRMFYLSVLPLSLIIIISAMILRVGENSVGFLFVFLFIGGSITVLIRKLMQLQKNWRLEKRA